MEFTHLNQHGRAHMADVSQKENTKRVAIARGNIRVSKETLDKIQEGIIAKGDVLSVAQIAGIMGAKKTSDLIPMCHHVSITGANIRFNIIENGIEVESEIHSYGKTGVEMEALTAVMATCLTIYDMCKSVDKHMIIEEVKLIKKIGGKTLDYIAKGVQGKVVSINKSDKKNTIKTPIYEGLFIKEHGLQNDAHSGNHYRQVSLLAIESINKLEIKDHEVKTGMFAENITTEGIILYDLPIGTKLVIGETIQEITTIDNIYHMNCDSSNIDEDCVLPTEGVFTKVLKGGVVKVGDIIEVI